MTDIMSADKRSALMGRVRAKDTKPELLLRRYLWRSGFRYVLHAAQLPGKPDLVLPKWNAIVFVHGCFWHAHQGCPYFQLPKTRSDFWSDKLQKNSERDSTATKALARDGWRVATVWECAIRADAGATGRRLARWLRSRSPWIELEAADFTRRNRPVRTTN